MANMLTDSLVKEPAFHYEQQKKDDEFVPALMEEIKYHYNNK